MEKNKRLLSFVIPCYRSSQTVTLVVEEILATVKQRENCFNYEIVLVNDGSDEATSQTIIHLSKTYSNVVAVDLARNFGQHAAIMAGFNEVHGDIIICLDDDGQTPANEAFKLIDKLDEGYDLVYARYAQKKHNFFRNFGSKVNAISNEIMLDVPKELYKSSYFACRRFLVDSALKYKNPFPYVAGLLMQGTKRYANVDVTHRERQVGDSGYSFKKLLHLWLNGFTAFSVLPLRFASVFGLVSAVVGFFFAVATIINKLLNPSVQAGWSSLMSILLIMSGIILLVIGMLGEYVGRIYMSINNLPQFVVREKYDYRTEQKEQK